MFPTIINTLLIVAIFRMEGWGGIRNSFVILSKLSLDPVLWQLHPLWRLTCSVTTAVCATFGSH